MATVQAVWIGGSGYWHARLHWNDDIVPNNNHPVKGDTYEVYLPRSTAYTVTISAGENFTVDSVAITDPLATLAVDGTSSTHTSLTVTGTSATAFKNAGTFGLHNYATVIVDGDFANGGALDVDNVTGGFGYAEGGSSLTITGTLTNTGTVQVGSTSLNAATTVTLGGLTNSGSTDSFILDGSASYAATLAFSGGDNSFTSNGGTFELTYAAPLTLTLTSGSSFTNSGTFGLHIDTAVTVDGGFANSGTLDVDNVTGGFGYAEGGSSLTITGTLANTGTVQVGSTSLNAATTVTLGGLTNSSSTDSFSLTGSASYAADLVFSSGTGFTSNGGTFELTYASPLTLSASFTNSGTFGLHIDTAVTVDGGFVNSGTLDVDNVTGGFGYAEGGSSLTITGTLANTGTVQVGSTSLNAPTMVTLGGLTNSGSTDSFSLDGSSSYGATLTFNGSGFTSNGGTFELTYASLTFSGGASVINNNSGTFELTDVSPLTLSSRFTNSGMFGLHIDTAVTVDGGFANSGTLDVDNVTGGFGYAEGGSSLTITGTLANTGTVQVGSTSLNAATTVTLGGLTNSSSTDSFSANGSSATNEVTVTVDGLVSNAGTLNVGDYSVFDVTGGNAFTQTAGTTTVSANGFFSASTINVDGGTFVVDTTNFNVSDTGKLVAADGGVIDFSAGGLTNLKNGVLKGGTYEVDAGSILQLTNNDFIRTDDADIILSGAGSKIQDLETNSNRELSFDRTLRTIGKTGQLHLLAGRSLKSAAEIINDGQLELGGGTLAVTGFGSSLTDGAGSKLYGFGVVNATTFTNSGTIEASGGTLTLTHGVTGKGTDIISGAATLEFDANVSAGQTVTFTGSGGELALKEAQDFHALISGFGTGDSIDAMNFVPPPATTWSFSENSADTLATLTLTDGADVAHFHLAGDYVRSDFKVGPNVAGTGTLIKFV